MAGQRDPTLRWVGRLANSLAQLIREPQLHPDERLPPFLGELAPWLGPGQHVAHTALGQSQHLQQRRDMDLTHTQAPPAKSPQGHRETKGVGGSLG